MAKKKKSLKKSKQVVNNLVMYCIVCGKGLELAMSVDDNDLDILPDIPISDGLMFSTSGHYGSRVFDPFPKVNDYLEIAICDVCMGVHADKVRHVKVCKSTQKTILKAKWDVESGSFISQ